MVQSLGYGSDTTYKVWGTIQKVNLLSRVAQTLIYPRSSSSLTDVRLFVRIMLNKNDIMKCVCFDFSNVVVLKVDPFIFLMYQFS